MYKNNIEKLKKLENEYKEKQEEKNIIQNNLNKELKNEKKLKKMNLQLFWTTFFT